MARARTVIEKNKEFDPYHASEEAKELQKSLSTMTNVMGASGLYDVAMLAVRDHRTLQQGLMRNFIWPLLQLWADAYENNRYDERNADTCKAAHTIIQNMPHQGFRFI